MHCRKAIEREKKSIKIADIPDLLNQLLAIVTSAARPSTNSLEKSFILDENSWVLGILLKYSEVVRSTPVFERSCLIRRKLPEDVVVVVRLNLAVT
jgi:hypothetical protein